MKKYVVLSLAGLLCLSFSSLAQKTDSDPNVIQTDDGRSLKRLFKIQNVTEDKTEVIDIIGTSNASFSASNTADGSSSSYKHSLRITLSLSTPSNIKGNYQLIFYSTGESIPYAAASIDGIVAVFYPMSMYEGIKQRLDQSFAAKKKVQLKVVQKTNGYREGTLMF